MSERKGCEAAGDNAAGSSGGRQEERCRANPMLSNPIIRAGARTKGCCENPRQLGETVPRRFGLVKGKKHNIMGFRQRVRNRWGKGFSSCDFGFWHPLGGVRCPWSVVSLNCNRSARWSQPSRNGRIQSKCCFNFADALTAGVIQVQCLHGCTAHGGQAFNLIALEPEVL